jgi:hypothetical protein
VIASAIATAVACTGVAVLRARNSGGKVIALSWTLARVQELLKRRPLTPLLYGALLIALMNLALTAALQR